MNNSTKQFLVTVAVWGFIFVMAVWAIAVYFEDGQVWSTECEYVAPADGQCT